MWLLDSVVDYRNHNIESITRYCTPGWWNSSGSYDSVPRRHCSVSILYDSSLLYRSSYFGQWYPKKRLSFCTARQRPQRQRATSYTCRHQETVRTVSRKWDFTDMCGFLLFVRSCRFADAQRTNEDYCTRRSSEYISAYGRVQSWTDLWRGWRLEISKKKIFSARRFCATPYCEQTSFAIVHLWRHKGNTSCVRSQFGGNCRITLCPLHADGAWGQTEIELHGSRESFGYKDKSCKGYKDFGSQMYVITFLDDDHWILSSFRQVTPRLDIFSGPLYTMDTAVKCENVRWTDKIFCGQMGASASMQRVSTLSCQVQFNILY